MNTKKILYIIFIFQLCHTTNGFSQITQKGKLKSKKMNSKNAINNLDIPTISMPFFEVNQLLEEDKQNKNNDKPLRFAKVFDTKIDIKQEGIMEKSEYANIWRLKIESKGAYSLNFIFKDYELPKDAELYIYNFDQSHIIGALTEINNNETKTVPVHPIKGDIAIIEYYEPLNSSFKGKCIISKVGHDYKGILSKFDGSFKSSQGCNIDINCAEGEHWQNESHSVCRILINGNSLCTGSLINSRPLIIHLN